MFSQTGKWTKRPSCPRAATTESSQRKLMSFFDHPPRGAECLPDCIHVFRTVEPNLPLTVISEGSGLKHALATEVIDSALKRNRVIDDPEVRMRDFLVPEEGFFSFSVLAEVEGTARWKDGPSLLDRFDEFPGNVFKFKSNNIHSRDKVGDCLGVEVRGVDFSVSKLTGRAGRVFVSKNDDLKPSDARFAREHATELAAADDAEVLAWLEHVENRRKVIGWLQNLSDALRGA